MRTLIIGDVHGCIEELEALAEALSITPGDEVVFVGDLVAKGPASADVVAWAVRRGARAVLGNHDAAVVAAARAQEGREPGFRFRAEHEAVAELLGDAERRYLEALPLSLSLDAHGAIVVHAGLVPGRPLAAQRRQDLLTMRTLDVDGEGSARFEGIPWASCWTGPEHVYFGHDARRGLQQYPFATGLDTGCVYGGRLTACSLPGGQLFSVAARRAYRPMGGA